jgi:L-amino acid N-acyltransferase YncA
LIIVPIQEVRIMPLALRPAAPADAAQVQAIYAPYCSTPISFELTPPSVEEMRRRLEKLQGRYPWLVCDRAAEVLGYAYASPHRERPAYQWSVDVSVYIRSDCHRGGLGRRLYTALFDVLVRQGFINAYAGVTLPNPASVGLHEAVGFTPVGVYRRVGYKCGGWHDVAWFERPLQGWPDVPAPPRPLSGIAWESVAFSDY